MDCIKNMLLGATVGIISILAYQQFANGNVQKTVKNLKKDACNKLENMMQ